MLRRFLCVSLLLLLLPAAFAAPFPVAAHSDVNIEWWYINAHVTTDKGRHLAVVGSFFRFGNGVSPFDGVTPLPRAHYLIYAVTDLDKKTQRPYSLADHTMVSLLPLLIASQPKTPQTAAFLTLLRQGKLPPPHQEIMGRPKITNTPFALAYGADNTLAATNSASTAYNLNLDAGGLDKIHLTLASQKPTMAVGGKGETGLRVPTDMYYFSLTRCAVGGTIDTGSGPEKIVDGQGWLDHQWGNSWVASNNGWDWFGIQLSDGTDILVFRQRDLKTGRIFFPLATFMDKDGHQSVTRNIVFTPDPNSLWKSPQSGVKYPLSWGLKFPEKGLQLNITAAVSNQEIPILGPGGGIWEGRCAVDAFQQVPPTGTRFAGRRVEHVAGVAYMELVGYNSPAVRAKMTRGK